MGLACMDTPDITPESKSAVAQLTAGITAAAALGLDTLEFCIVVAATALVATATVVAGAQIRESRNNRLAYQMPVDPVGDEVADADAPEAVGDEPRAGGRLTREERAEIKSATVQAAEVADAAGEV